MHTLKKFNVRVDFIFYLSCNTIHSQFNHTGFIMVNKRKKLIYSSDPLQRVVTISHDGKLMATGGVDGKVRVWSFPKMQLLFELQGHTKEVSWYFIYWFLDLIT